MTANLAIPVEKVARLIQTFSREQKILLLQLVPELQTLRVTQKADISEEQARLMAYFQAKIAGLPVQNPLQDDDIPLEDLTVAEFFALPEQEQDRLWQNVHSQDEAYAVSRRDYRL